MKLLYTLISTITYLSVSNGAREQKWRNKQSRFAYNSVGRLIDNALKEQIPSPSKASSEGDPDSCCDFFQGSQCFCKLPEFNVEEFSYGDCDCNDMVSFSVVYLRGPLAKLILFYDTLDESNIRCKYENILSGEQLICYSGNNAFSESTSFKIIYDDNTECIGSFDTSCSTNIVGTKSDQCQDLVITAFEDKNGGFCEDGIEPCNCDNSAIPKSRPPSLSPDNDGDGNGIGFPMNQMDQIKPDLCAIFGGRHGLSCQCRESCNADDCEDALGDIGLDNDPSYCTQGQCCCEFECNKSDQQTPPKPILHGLNPLLWTKAKQADGSDLSSPTQKLVAVGTTTNYSRYSFYTLVFIAVINIIACSYCLCLRPILMQIELAAAKRNGQIGSRFPTRRIGSILDENDIINNIPSDSSDDEFADSEYED